MSNSNTIRMHFNITFNVIFFFLVRYIKYLKSQFLVYFFITINYNRIKCNFVFNIKTEMLTRVSYHLIRNPGEIVIARVYRER